MTFQDHGKLLGCRRLPVWPTDVLDIATRVLQPNDVFKVADYLGIANVSHFLSVHDPLMLVSVIFIRFNHFCFWLTLDVDAPQFGGLVGKAMEHIVECLALYHYETEILSPTVVALRHYHEVELPRHRGCK